MGKQTLSTIARADIRLSEQRPLMTRTERLYHLARESTAFCLDEEHPGIECALWDIFGASLKVSKATLR